MVPFDVAWQQALYGTDGFFRRERPARHFRTSAHVPLFAEALLALVRRVEATTVVDVGAGGGEVLTALHRLDPDLDLVGVEVGPRPRDLPMEVAWRTDVPDRVDGLLVANEWLDDVPTPVVELDDDGVVREVLVDPASGVESPGPPVEGDTLDWLERWWVLGAPGERAEVGLPRDLAWADAAGRVDGLAVAVDYGHVRAARPPFGSVRSYLDGREVEVRLDGSRDVTAHVAVDSVAERVRGSVLRQRDALALLGVDGSRPDLGLARADPVAYLAALNRSGEAAELRARGGLGDFWWVVSGPLATRSGLTD